jgi:hypothetical protein
MEELDRTKICPFLLRCYWKMNRHHVAGDYRQAARDIFPANEIIMYVSDYVFPLSSHIDLLM